MKLTIQKRVTGNSIIMKQYLDKKNSNLIF